MFLFIAEGNWAGTRCLEGDRPVPSDQDGSMGDRHTPEGEGSAWREKPPHHKLHGDWGKLAYTNYAFNLVCYYIAWIESVCGSLLLQSLLGYYVKCDSFKKK